MGSIRVAKGAISYDLEAGKRRSAARAQRRSRQRIVVVALIAGSLLGVWLARRQTSPIARPSSPAVSGSSQKTPGISTGPTVAPTGTAAPASTGRSADPSGAPTPPNAPVERRLIVDGADAILGIQHLDAGFEPNPVSVTGSFGGPINIRTLNLASGCLGLSTALPTWLLDVARDYSGPLELSVDATKDTALVVLEPSGGWLCNDDARSNVRLTVTKAQSGRYRVWVASYDGARSAGTLSVAESGRAKVAVVMQPVSAPSTDVASAPPPPVVTPVPSPVPPVAPTQIRVTVRAPFPFRVEADRREIGSFSPAQNLVLPAGPHTLELTSPVVFLRQTIQIDGRTEAINQEIPDVVPLQIAANPANARVRINGWYAGTLPLTVRAARGVATFDFEWPETGRRLTITREVESPNQIVFVQAPR